MALDTSVGTSTSESYGTLAAYKTYCTAMGLSLVDSAGATISDANLEIALRRATAYMDRTYDWRGIRTLKDQALDWPRTIFGPDDDDYSIPTDSIPVKITHAQFEIANLISLGKDLMAYDDQPEVKSKEVAAGPARVKTEYVSGSEDQAPIRAIGRLLEGYISGSGSASASVSMQLVRG